MKAWKKLTVLLLALGLTAGFAACGGGDGGNGGGTESSVQTGNSESSSVGGNSESSSEGGNSEGSGSSSVEYVGEEATAAEIEAAIQAAYEKTNFMIVGESYQEEDGVVTTATYTTYCADGKVYTYGTMTQNGNATNYYQYIGMVDDEYYVWSSTDQEIWYWEVYEGTVNPATGKYFLEETFSAFYGGYERFNATTGMYELSGFGTTPIQFMISDGEIVKFRCEPSETNWYGGTIYYGGESVGELPPLD